ncbi:MAG TPA: hypothetical protein PK325_15745 [Cyclobacteriaceae bacterium]|nr:hypothetical protein [Cyclobacteriaceae bacterium]HMV09813.1 hypothetical protein [Cyclobacteriaceae bacterium]HMV89583.1 hypothetical protein [Cyclobacteriaceae bacterium]HMX00478.1 hypothetical protein [Cyclobacteriaceae bacterium]HMX50438.1 hypothetical protein [Cyclobacteriaceae bacterium]
MKPFLLACTMLFCLSISHAQVDEIKSASKNNSKKSGHSSDSDDGDGVGLDVFFFLFDGLGSLHTSKLQNRENYPSAISVDIALAGAIKPASYYVLQPRIRGNWGLFSTDFRMSYLIEDDVEGFKHIRTNDWQVLGLNLITNRFFTFRVSTGFMQEAFADHRYFSESAVALNVHAPDQSKVLGFEFRFAKDWDSGLNPRREFSVQYQHQIFQASALHGYVSLGGLYQRYYNSIDVWGVQGGLVFRFF